MSGVLGINALHLVGLKANLLPLLVLNATICLVLVIHLFQRQKNATQMCCAKVNVFEP